MNYPRNEIEVEQGERFFLKDNLNQIWLINILNVGISEVKLELIRKTTP